MLPNIMVTNNFVVSNIISINLSPSNIYSNAGIRIRAKPLYIQTYNQIKKRIECVSLNVSSRISDCTN